MRFLAPLLLLLASCSSSSGEEGPCRARSGTYVQHFAERRLGTCGPLGDVVSPSGEIADPECTDSGSGTPDGCTVNVDRSCAGPDIGHARVKGAVTWDHDGENASGVLSIFITKPDGTECYSVYDDTVSRR